MEAPVIMLKQTLSTDASQSNQVNAKEKTKAAGVPSVHLVVDIISIHITLAL